MKKPPGKNVSIQLNEEDLFDFDIEVNFLII